MYDLTLKRIKISITNACNLGCAHCYLSDDDYTFLDLNSIKNLLDDAQTVGVEVIDLTGGEPTMHPHFKEIVMYAYDLGFRINLSTNGLNLNNEELLSLLAETKIECHISLDATSEEVLSKIRGEGVYTALQNTFSTLRKHGIAYTLRFSLNKMNFKEVPAIIDYAISTNTNISFGATQLAGHADKSMLLDNDDFNWVKTVIQAKKQDCPIAIEECFTHSFPCDGACMDILSVNHYGQPVSCLMVAADEDREKISRSIPSADLHNMFEKALADKQKLKSFSMTDKCIKCKFNYLCKSGCLVTAHTMGCI